MPPITTLATDERASYTPSVSSQARDFRSLSISERIQLVEDIGGRPEQVPDAAAHSSQQRDFCGPVRNTNIVIDDKLMAATLKATGIKTKREAVEQGLRTLLRLKQQTELRQLRGKYEWVGDLDAMRRDK